MGFAVARTQEVDLESQLKLGVRMLQAQGRLYAFSPSPLLPNPSTHSPSGTKTSCTSVIHVRLPSIRILSHAYLAPEF